MYRNNMVNFQESTTVLNACLKKVWKLIEGTMCYLKVYISPESIYSPHSTLMIDKLFLIAYHLVLGYL